MLDYYQHNNLCEICYAHGETDYSKATMDLYMINTHCIELRRNRESRKNKNAKPIFSVF